LNKSNFNIILSPIEEKSSGEATWKKMSGTSLFFARYGIFVFFIAFFVFFSILRPTFISFESISDILNEASLICFVALGQAIVIAVGGVDLSVGNIAGFGAMMASFLCVGPPLGGSLWAPIAIAIGVIMGGVIGACNGLLVSRLYVNSFIATLGMQFVLWGLLYMLTFGYTLTPLPGFFENLGIWKPLNIPFSIYVMAVVFILCYLFMEKTKYGRYILMVGENIEACRLSGVPILNTTLLAFSISGLLCPLSGIFLAARQNLANVDLGERFLLQSFTAALLGNVIFGGKNIILGTLLGAIFLVVVVHGMELIGTGPEWVYFIQGALLVGAILLNYNSKRIMARI